MKQELLFFVPSTVNVYYNIYVNAAVYVDQMIAGTVNDKNRLTRSG